MKKSNIKSYTYFFQSSNNKIDRKWQAQSLSATYVVLKKYFPPCMYFEFIDIIFCRSCIHVKLCMISENAFWQFDFRKILYLVYISHSTQNTHITAYVIIMSVRYSQYCLCERISFRKRSVALKLHFNCFSVQIWIPRNSLCYSFKLLPFPTVFSRTR